MQQSLGESHPFRLRHRDGLWELVSAIVRNRMDQGRASAYIEQWTVATVAVPSQERFRRTVESALLALTREDFARSRTRLAKKFEAIAIL